MKIFHIKSQPIFKALVEALNETAWVFYADGKRQRVTVYSDTVAEKVKEQLDNGKYKYEMVED